MSALLSVAELSDLLGTDGALVVLDVQFALGGPASTELYAAAHLPGARHLSLDDVLADPPGREGRHPLPDPIRLQNGLRALGLDDDSTVVVYDQRTSLSAARAWWVLTWAGLDGVRVLDGGLAAWQAAGLPVTTEQPVFPKGSVTVRPGALPVLDADGAAAVAHDGILLDSRVAERFRGESEPIDAVAGHIPGAVNTPMATYLDEAGRFLPPEALREHFAPLGVAPGTAVGTSCGSGVTAAHTALALHEIGVDAQVYIGSWSEWITDPSRPIATGG